MTNPRTIAASLCYAEVVRDAFLIADAMIAEGGEAMTDEPDTEWNSADIPAPHGEPVIAEYHEYDHPLNPTKEQVVWWYDEQWRRYPDTDARAFVDRWRNMPTHPPSTSSTLPISDEQTQGVSTMERLSLVCATALLGVLVAILAYTVGFLLCSFVEWRWLEPAWYLIRLMVGAGFTSGIFIGLMLCST